MLEANKKPNFCDLIITEACMLRCKMCNMWQSRPGSDGLPIDIWKRFVDSLAGFAEENTQVQFVGGEPLFKEGVLDLIRHTSGKGFLTTMTTNAYLIDEKIVKELVSSGLSTLVVSIDSSKRETHDLLRGVEGVYDRAVNAIELARKLGKSALKIHVVTTIMQPNLDDLMELAKWADQDRAIDHISFQVVVQPFFTSSDNAWYRSKEFSFLWPKDINKVDAVLDGLADLKKRGCNITNPAAQFEVFKAYFRDPDRFVRVSSKCNLGYNSVSVNTSGKIFLCLSMDPIGDISSGRSIQDIWSSGKTMQVREDIKKCKNNCKSMINCFFEEEVAI